MDQVHRSVDGSAAAATNQSPLPHGRSQFAVATRSEINDHDLKQLLVNRPHSGQLRFFCEKDPCPFYNHRYILPPM
jgi:hypothetical protein